MADEVKTKLSVDGADALQELARVQSAEQQHADAIEETGKAAEEASRAQKEAGRATQNAGDEANEGAKKQGFLARQLDNVTSSAGAMIAGFFGLQTVISYFDRLNEAAEKTIERLDGIAEKANEAAQATLDLHAISLGFNEDDERIVSGFSKATGRSFQESASALTKFRSSTAALSREEQDQLFNEALLPLSLTTGGSIDPASKFIGRISSITQDPEEIKNLVAQSVQLAGESDPAQFLGVAGELLVTGNAAGLTPADTLSLLAFSSGKFETSVAGTGLRNSINKLTADPATREELGRLGVDPSGGFFSTLNQLSEIGAGTEQIIPLVGLENSSVLTALVSEYDTAQNFRQQTTQSLASGDLVGGFLQELVEKSPRHARALQIAQLEQELADLERQDADKAQALQIARTRVEIELERAVQAGTITTAAKDKRLERFDDIVAGPGGLTLAAAGISDGSIPLSEEQRARYENAGLDTEDVVVPPHLAKDFGITFEQILAAAAQDVEAGLLISNVLPGGDVSADVGDISASVVEDLQNGPTLPDSRLPLNGRQETSPPEPSSELPDELQPTIEGESRSDLSVGGRTLINYGNIYSGAGDALLDDLDGRDRA